MNTMTCAGERVVLEADSNWTTQARYTLQGGGWFDPLVSMRRGDSSSFYHYDALGSADRLTDTSQAVTDSYLHKAFGILAASTGSTVNPFRFVARFGYYRDPSTDLLQLGVRHYAPVAGRFITRDPIRQRNRYCYVRNAPVLRSDPSGLWHKDDHYDWTVQATRGLVVTVGDQKRSLPQIRHVAKANREVDEVHSWLGSGWHFETETCQSPHTPRSDLAESHLKVAILLASLPARYEVPLDWCPHHVWPLLGRALHAFQDTFSHGPATPCEHEHAPNQEWIDDPDVDTDWKVEDEVTGDDWHEPILRTAHGYFINRYCGCRDPHKRIRVFEHSPGTRRKVDTMRKTRNVLRRFLREVDPDGMCFARESLTGPSAPVGPRGRRGAGGGVGERRDTMGGRQ